MDLATLRSQVRTTLDTDEEDLPDVLLDMWLEEGFERIVDFDQRWPFYEATWTYDWVAPRASYAIEDVGADIARISSIIADDDRELVYTGHDTASRQYANANYSTGTPEQWSVYGDRLYLWPTPAGDVSLDLRGYREPTPFSALTAGAAPDLPTKYHKLLVRWALHMAYERDEDTELSAYNRQHFEDQLRLIQGADRAVPTPQPIVIGGGRRLMVPFGPKFPFE